MGDEATKDEPMTCDPMIKELPTRLSDIDRAHVELAHLRAERAALAYRLLATQAQTAQAEAQRFSAQADATFADIAKRYAIDPATQSIDLATGEIRSKKP